MAVIIAGLELAARYRLVAVQLFPAPSAVAAKLWQIASTGRILLPLYNSLRALLLALALTVCLVVVMALISRRQAFFRHLFSALAGALNPIPSIAVLPLFLLWFGIGEGTVIATLLHSTIWSFYEELLNGLDSVPPIYQTVADALNMRGLNRFIHLTAPACLAAFLTGLKGAWARAWRALIGVEMIFGTIAASSGLGWFIFESRAFADSPAIVAGLIIIAVFGYLFEYVAFNLIERQTVVKWGMK